MDHTVNEKRKTLHLAWIIATVFFLSNLAFIASLFVIPSIADDGKPVIPMLSITLGKLQTAMYMLGCVALGVKLGEEKKTIAAIGFTMMSIAQGIIFIIYSISVNSNEALEETFRIFSSSMYVLIPSMILIAFYSDFPKWLNVLGIVAFIPMLIENIIFAVTHTYTRFILNLDGVGQLLFSLTAFFWGLYILRNAKRQLREEKIQ